MKHKKRNVRFSYLPGKIIFKISKKLETRDDILRFKQVCSKWRKRSLTLPTNLLSLNLPLPQTIKNNSKAFPFHNSKSALVLRVSNIYLITPSQDTANDQSPWMVMAEELNPGKIKVRHPLTAKRVKNFPPFLDMNQFKALKLAEGYNFKSSNCVQKVLLCSNSASSVQVLVLYYKGVLGKLSLDVLDSRYVNNDDDDDDDDDEEEELSYSWENFRVRQGGTLQFMYLDDVAMFKGTTFGVDRKGRLYILNTDSMSRLNTVVLCSKPIYRGDRPNNRRKRLVVDPTSGDLHLVVRERLQVAGKVRFKVYKLNEQDKCWDVIDTIGHEKVLFVGIDHCFFAMARHFPGCDGNSIVFASHCFTQYNGYDAPDNSLFNNEETDVGMYRLGVGDNFQLLSLACPEFAGTLWPPPTWFCTRENSKETEEGDATHQSQEVGDSSSECLSDDHVEGLLSESSSGETECTSDDDNDNDVEMLSDSPDKDEEMESECSGDIESNASGGSFSDQIHKEHSEAQEQPSEEHSDAQEQTTAEHSDAQEKTTAAHSDAQKQTTAEHSDAQKKTTAEHSDAPEQPINDHFASPLLGSEAHEFMEANVCDSNRTPVTPSSSVRQKSSTVKFQGVDIRSGLLPTLQTIWANHGNLFTKDTIHSKKMLGCAMEELAELIITLKNTRKRTLTDSKVDEMKSTVSDIKRAGLKVQWLESVMEAVVANNKRKAKVEEEEREYLSLSAKIKQELEEETDQLLTKIPFPKDQDTDLDDFLGDGI